MRRPVFFLLLLMFSCTGKPELSRALRDLDYTIAVRDSIATLKEQQIDSLRLELRGARDSRSRYHISDALFHMYLQWDLDSALHYAHFTEACALEMGGQEYLNESYMDLADRYRLSGMYHNAIATLSQIDTAVIASSGQEARYYNIFFETYYGLARTVKDSVLIRDYKSRENAYLYLMQHTSKEGDPLYYSNLARTGILEGRLEETKELLLRRLSQKGVAAEEKNAIHARLAKIYMVEEDEVQAMIHYARSAQLDFLLAKKEYGALIVLAQILYKNGDLPRAYTYITTAYTDAVAADVRVSLNVIGSSLTLITEAYEHQLSIQNAKLGASVVLLIILLVAISFNLLALNRKRIQLNRAKNEIELKAEQLLESNTIKDSCMGEFLALFSEHTNSLERYQSRLRVAAKQFSFNAIQEELHSNAFIEEESRFFYDRFDQFFLRLFPHFIDQVNALLQPEKQIGAHLPDGRLNNELRLLALIRLGVSDSTRIARFLKRSPKTIFNLRVILRNSALTNRDDFEQQVMSLHSQ